MAKNCLIYETLNGVKEMQVSRSGDFMTLSGVFGVCGVKNNNQRIYEASNYSKMVAEMQERIKNEGGIPGELEHPQQMNITLENVSHKITDINIDENGVVTGSITLLNTPKGKIAQAIVEGGLPLFISSRATGNVDKAGKVCLERISTYDLVGTPGFSQAKLHLNENQIAESICESMFYIAEKEEEIINENNENDDMELNQLMEKLEALEARIQELENDNEDLRGELELNEAAADKLNLESIANGIQNWLMEEYTPSIKSTIMEEVGESQMDEEAVREVIESYTTETLAPAIQNWIVEEYAPEVQNWLVEEYAPEVQNWLMEDYTPEVKENILESVKETVQDMINEAAVKNNNTNSIDETLKMLESLEVAKPSFPTQKAVVTESVDEPKFIAEMPAEKRVEWNMASQEVKESITRRAKLYNFCNEGAVERFWESVNFENVAPSKSIYEGLQSVEDERERLIRARLRAWKSNH